MSISPTFYEQLLRQNPFAKKLQAQIVSTLMLRKELLYEKAAHKILVKLTPVVSVLSFFGLSCLSDAKLGSSSLIIILHERSEVKRYQKQA